ncbi:MAG: bifunctional phosphoribosyl-AMP cyclohydrolase/phosphoribosyl-ATP diphosphatase HisIE [Deltaproteobacteria bacterium]
MIEGLKYNENGLIPAIVQDCNNGQVLMMAYMSEEALKKTIETRRTCFWSRSRQELWVKGETSGNIQTVKEIRYDCDQDTLLVLVEQTGPACHTGHYSCFYRNEQGEEVAPAAMAMDQVYESVAGPGILYELYEVVRDRQVKRPEGSYTTYLFDKGIDKILKKVGEESAEVLIAAKNRDKGEVVYETADLIYHLIVLMVEQGVDLADIFLELKSRR